MRWDFARAALLGALVSLPLSLALVAVPLSSIYTERATSYVFARAINLLTIENDNLRGQLERRSTALAPLRPGPTDAPPDKGASELGARRGRCGLPIRLVVIVYVDDSPTRRSGR